MATRAAHSPLLLLTHPRYSGFTVSVATWAAAVQPGGDDRCGCSAGRAPVRCSLSKFQSTVRSDLSRDSQPMPARVAVIVDSSIYSDDHRSMPDGLSGPSYRTNIRSLAILTALG